MPLITQQQLARVASKAVPHIATAIVDHADEVLPRYGIITPLRIQHFVAQVLVESGYLRAVEEDLSYSAERLHAVWPKRFPTVAAAQAYAHRPEALAAIVYGGRMGNQTPEDAYANRGLGLLQTTGADNLGRLAAQMNVTVDQMRGMLVSDAWMLECAAASFAMLGALPHADRDDVVAVSRTVNGGTNGLADRQAALKLCKRVWTAQAVITPATLAPRSAPPIAPSPILVKGPAAVTPSTEARMLEAFEKIAASPQTAAMVQRVLSGAEAGVAAQPDTGVLAGKKTYIIAGIGIASTLATTAYAIVQNGGLTPAGMFAGIAALVTSSGFATLRMAMKGHYGELAGVVLDVGQQVALKVVEGQVQQGVQDVVTDPLSAVENGIGSLIPR